MGNDHPLRRIAQCYSKVRHDSLAEAQTEANRLSGERHYPMQVYHCPTCKGFHVGHPLQPRKPKPIEHNIRVRERWRDPARFGEPLTEEETIARAQARNELRRQRQLGKRGKPRCEVIVCGRGPHPCDGMAMRGLEIDGHRVCAFHGIEHPEQAVFTVEDAMALKRERRERKHCRLWLTEAPA